MLERLTPEQESLLPVYRDKWLKIGLSTEPCDRVAAEKAASAAYIMGGLKPPREFIWFDSPLSLATSDEIRNSSSDRLASSVRNYAAAVTVDMVWDCVKTSVRDSVWDSVSHDIIYSVGKSVKRSVEAGVQEWIKCFGTDSDWHPARNVVYGNHDAPFLAFHDYLLEVCDIKSCGKIKPLMNLALNCGWWLPKGNTCLLSEKPTICLLKDGLIHSEDSPAIAYRDFAVWAIDGVRVDEQIVMRPETQTLEQIRFEPDEKVQRIRVSRYSNAMKLKQE